MASTNPREPATIREIQLLLSELEKKQPDSKVIKSLTSKYGIPYKPNLSEQLDELLMYLNGLTVFHDQEPKPEP